VATWDTGGSSSLGNSITALVDTSFPKGQAFGQWLVSVGASSTPGSIMLGSDVKSTALTTLPGISQQWIYQTTPSSYVHYFTFNAPVGKPATAQCGRFVFTGLHVATAVISNPDAKGTFPSNCVITRDLSGPEKALEFMMFDLVSCLMPDPGIPTPPPVGGNSAPPTPPEAGGAPPSPPPPPPPPAPPPPARQY
jgi:hypothetical protein